MKRLLLILCSVILLLGFQGEALALNFTLESYDVDLLDADPGLVLYWEPILAQPFSFDLEVGESTEVVLLEIGTDETWANLGDDIFWKDLFVSFDFSSPDVINNIDGKSRGVWLFQVGKVEWDGPTEFYFGDTGLFTVTLNDICFPLPGSAEVKATIEYVQAPSAVPEPATVLLLGSGLLGGILIRRKTK